MRGVADAARRTWSSHAAGLGLEVVLAVVVGAREAGVGGRRAVRVRVQAELGVERGRDAGGRRFRRRRRGWSRVERLRALEAVARRVARVGGVAVARGRARGRGEVVLVVLVLVVVAAGGRRPVGRRRARRGRDAGALVRLLLVWELCGVHRRAVAPTAVGESRGEGRGGGGEEEEEEEAERRDVSLATRPQRGAASGTARRTLVQMDAAPASESCAQRAGVSVRA